MKNINIAGRLGKDAEIRDSKSGPICKFSVAVDSRKGSEKVTTWFDVSIFGKRGEALRQYLTKGTTVAVVGDLDARMYEKDGQTRIALGVVASDITLLGGKRDDQRGGPSNDRPAPSSDWGGGEFGGGDDLPFMRAGMGVEQ